jgi:tetratricopeptide (TPR) repeat protein
MAGRLIFAQMNFRAGRFDVAVEHYAEAAKQFPEGSYGASAAWSGLGYAHAAAGSSDDAIAAFTKVADGRDTALKADALYQAGLLYRKTGQESRYNEIVQTLRAEHSNFMYADMLPAPKDG